MATDADIVWDDEVIWDDEGAPQPAAAPARTNGLVPREGEDQGALVRRRINAVLQGVGGTANYLADLGARAGNSLGIRDPNLPMPSDRFAAFLEQVGLDKPTGTDTLVGGLIGGRADPFGRAIAGARPRPTPATPPAPLTVEQRTRNAGLAQGLKIAPRFVENTPFGNMLEPLANRAALQENLQRSNRPVFDAMARRVNRMAPTDDLTPESLRERIAQYAREGYEPIERLGFQFRPGGGYRRGLQDIIDRWAGSPQSNFPQRRDIAAVLEQYDVPSFTGRDAIRTSARLREEANALLNGATPNQPLGMALRDVSRLIEDTLDQNLSFNRVGTPDMLARFRDARRQIAIAHETIDALVPGTGSVDARVFTRKLQQGVPLTDELRQIGEFGGAFSQMSQLPQKGEALLYDRPSLGLGASTVGLFGQVLGAPARRVLQSDAYQRTLRATPAAPYAPMDDWAATGFGNAPGIIYNLFQPE